jgi:hypothetical protein
MLLFNNRTNGTFIYRVRDCSNINNIIIPFFQQHPLVGVKHLDFLYFCKVASLMKSKAHLTSTGLAEIKVIKSGMNRGRFGAT